MEALKTVVAVLCLWAALVAFVIADTLFAPSSLGGWFAFVVFGPPLWFAVGMATESGRKKVRGFCSRHALGRFGPIALFVLAAVMVCLIVNGRG